MRKVIFHYHLFKNAGTSVDAIFRNFFPMEACCEREFPSPLDANRSEVKAWVKREKRCVYFSSHTAYLPPPKLLFTKVLPLIFVRHPLDRVASVYEFEKRSGGTSWEERLAANSDLAGYVDARLNKNLDRQCRNFHAQKLAFMYGEKYGPDLSRATKTIAYLPVVGVVDRFSESLKVLQAWLGREGVIDVRAELQPSWQNATMGRESKLHLRLKALEQELGPRVYQRLVDANQDDLEIYRLANAKLDSAIGACH